MSHIVMNVLPPELQSTYELVAKMGEGGMGSVFKVRHRHLDEMRVIKVMQARLQEIGTLRERFLREAKKGNQVRHRNIAEVLDFFVDSSGNAYLVMEYIDGKNLREVLLERQEPLDYQSVIAIGEQALEALQFLHANKLVHRDISPDNLMLTRTGDGALLVKLIDLGIAKSLEDHAALTATGSFMGKVIYAAPEQFRNQVDPRSDLYSFGIVLYELLTGTRPITGESTHAMVLAHMTAKPRTFAVTDPRGLVPEPVRRVVLKALEKDPSDRYQTAAEFSEALRRAGRTRTETIIPPLLPDTIPDSTLPGAKSSTTPAPPQRPPRMMQAAAALVIIALASGTAAVALRKRVEKPKNQPPPVVQTAATATMDVIAPTDVTAPTDDLTSTAVSAATALSRGRSLGAAGNLTAAYEAFAEATRKDPDNAYAWANLGAAAASLGKADEAQEAYDRALAIDSDNWLAHYNLGCLLERGGQREDALRHIEAATTQLRRTARSAAELEAVMSKIRSDDALRELRNDPRFITFTATQ